MNILAEKLTQHRKAATCLAMELDLEGQLADRAYPILASLVVPRPIALVTGEQRAFVSDRAHGLTALVLPNARPL